MDHAVDVAGQAHEEAELGDVPDLALDLGAARELDRELVPRIFLGLLEAERDAPLLRIHVEDHDVHFLARRNDLARMHVLLGPAHLGHMDQAFDARLQLDEGAVVGDVGHAAGEACADRVLEFHVVPRIRLELLHAEGDTLGLRVEAHDLDLDGLADLEGLGGMVDPAPRDVRDVEQAVDTAEIDERAVVGDVLDHALEHLAFLEVRDQLGALGSPGLLEDGAARDDDVAARPVHLEDHEGLRGAHERRDVAHGADVDLAARQERHGARQVDREAALHAAEDGAGDALGLLEGLLELLPGFFAAGLLARQHDLAVDVLVALDEDLDLVARGEFRRLSGRGEFLERNPALGLEADVDQREVALDRNDGAFDDRAFER